MARSRTASRRRATVRSDDAPHTRASRLESIGDGNGDPCANDESVLTRAQRLEAIGNGDEDPVNALTEKKKPDSPKGEPAGATA